MLKTPDSRKDYIYIEDLAAAILLTVEKKFAGIINWGTGTGTSVREIADLITAKLGCPELLLTQMPPATDLFPFVIANAGRLQQLGWRPEVDLQAGLTQLIKVLQMMPPFL